MKLFYFFAVTVLFLVGCGNNQSEISAVKGDKSAGVAFSTIIQTGVSGRESGNKTEMELIRNRDALLRFFPRIEKEKADEVDFAHDDVIAVYGGDEIKITSIEVGDSEVKVYVTVKVFAQNSPFYGIPYTPLHMVRIDKAELPVKFYETVDTVY